ncbi:MAG TPA: c-type cytochrome [Longimicrobiales bacterium]|nr:c-type cytochrome [Longimicrobiales bacterium]
MRVATLVLLAAPVLAGPAPASAQEPAADHPGKPVYDQWCAGCHGVEGDGEGPSAAWMLPRPRDFTDALYQIRTTPSGQLPTDADILRMIDEGMPGTAMPGWESQLSQRQRNDLVNYLKTFSRFFAMEDAPPAIEIGRAPRMSEDAIAEGREIYQRVECWKCHGDAGRGDGASAPTQADDRDFPIRPVDLTENWLFNGGGSLEEIYTRLRTGLDGTPMPSFSDLVDAGVITDEQLWRLAGYVRSLSPERAPEARDVVRAGLADALPSSVDDEAWEDAERYYIPLVGQIVIQPRWFSPTVDGVWVQALHDGETLAMRLTWHDPSRSPDPLWEPWRESLARFMEPTEGEQPASHPPDAFTVQFPSVMPEGRDLPYFLGGDSRSPAYLWRWRSDRQGIEEAHSRGLGQAEALAPAEGAGLGGTAAFEEGAWTLVIHRRLESMEPERRIGFPTGEPIPIAFFAQDGSSGEAGNRGSISSWYFLHLDRPVAASVYVVPIAATLLTALLGVGVVAQARRAPRSAEQDNTTLLEGA